MITLRSLILISKLQAALQNVMTFLGNEYQSWSCSTKKQCSWGWVLESTLCLVSWMSQCSGCGAWAWREWWNRQLEAHVHCLVLSCWCRNKRPQVQTSFSGCYQHKLATLLLWMSESQMSPAELRSTWQQDCVPSSDWRGESISLPNTSFGGYAHALSLASSPSSRSAASWDVSLSLSASVITLPLTLTLPFIRLS